MISRWQEEGELKTGSLGHLLNRLFTGDRRGSKKVLFLLSQGSPLVRHPAGRDRYGRGWSRRVDSSVVISEAMGRKGAKNAFLRGVSLGTRRR